MIGKLASYDLWGYFRGRDALVEGNVPLEHKLVFGRHEFSKNVEKHKKEVKNRYLKQKGLAGQLLWVTQVSDSKGLHVLSDRLLFCKRGSSWRSLLEWCDDFLEGRSFEDAWAGCRQQPKATRFRTKVVLLADFLRQAGKGGRHLARQVEVWSSQPNRWKLKPDDFCKQLCVGRGKAERWVASEAVLRKLWPALRA